MNGQIEVESRYGNGSVFSFTANFEVQPAGELVTSLLDYTGENECKAPAVEYSCSRRRYG